MAKNKATDKFININRIESAKVNGYQVRIREYTPFVGGLSSTSLKEALKKRNEFYESNHYMPPGIARHHMKESVPDLERTTGWHGLSYTIANEASGPLIISCTARHLATGKPHTISIRVHLHKTDKKAMNFSVKARNRNVEQYNKIVDAYNEMLYPTMIKYARREARTLTPCMHDLKGFDIKLWKKALNAVYPLGLASSTEAIEK